MAEAGVYVLAIDQSQIAKLGADAAAVSCKATVGGASPAITYGSHLIPA
ncbi:hypothetical protein [Microbaculum sp. FT89]